MRFYICILLMLDVATTWAANDTCKCTFTPKQMQGTITIYFDGKDLDRPFYLLPPIGHEDIRYSDSSRYHFLVDYSLQRALYDDNEGFETSFIHDMENDTLYRIPGDGPCRYTNLNDDYDFPNCLPSGLEERSHELWSHYVLPTSKMTFPRDSTSYFIKGRCTPTAFVARRSFNSTLNLYFDVRIIHYAAQVDDQIFFLEREFYSCNETTNIVE